MPRQILPAIGENPYGPKLNAAINNISDSIDLLSVDKGERFASKVLFRTENITIGIASDGTGNDTTDWFYRGWTNFLLPRPWLNCNFISWSNTTQAYIAPVVLKAGTGTQTIDIYNGGNATATTLSYQQARLSAMYPIPLDIMVIASGLYYGTDEPDVYLAKIDSFIKDFRAIQPQAGIVIASQNPRIAPAANMEVNNRRNSALKGYAASRGYGYMPTGEAIGRSAIGGGRADLISADGIQPSSAGYSIMGRAMSDYLNELTWQQ